MPWHGEEGRKLALSGVILEKAEIVIVFHVGDSGGRNLLDRRAVACLSSKYILHNCLRSGSKAGSGAELKAVPA